MDFSGWLVGVATKKEPFLKGHLILVRYYATDRFKSLIGYCFLGNCKSMMSASILILGCSTEKKGGGMMRIKATCTDCGDIELYPRDVKVRTCKDSGVSIFLFRCPECRMAEAHFTQPNDVEILLAVGCMQEVWHLPHELFDRRRFSSARLTHDDMLDFHIAISSASDEQIIMAASLVNSGDK